MKKNKYEFKKSDKLIMMNLTLNDFKHNELLINIMIEYMKIKDEQYADLVIENLWEVYKNLHESNRLSELEKICKWAITFYGIIDQLGRGHRILAH
ncbi:hypothetical protein [Yeosuana sp. AK3]